MIRFLKPDFSFEDERGKLVQLVHAGYEQINVLESKAGVFRGAHFHKVSTEAFYVVSGGVKVTLERESCKKEFHFSRGDFFEIEPFVKHSMEFTEDSTLIALYDRCVENADGTKDIFSI